MFNKSTLFNRSEPIPRRDTPQATPVNARPAAAGKEFQAAPVPSASAPVSTVATPSATEPKTPATADLGADSGMGARLIVGPEVKLKGAEILDCDTLVVEGRVEATMDSRVVRIAEKGSFVGKVSIDIAEIHGAFEGELTARSQLIIHSTGRVKGTIRYGRLVADEGCELCGDIAVLAPVGAVKPRPGSDVLVALDAVAG